VMLSIEQKDLILSLGCQEGDLQIVRTMIEEQKCDPKG